MLSVHVLTRGEGGQILAILELTYKLNDPLSNVLGEGGDFCRCALFEEIRYVLRMLQPMASFHNG